MRWPLAFDVDVDVDAHPVNTMGTVLYSASRRVWHPATHVGLQIQYVASHAQIIINLIAMCFVGAPKTRNRLPATHVGLQIQWGLHFFILDSRRVWHPALKVLGSDSKTHLNSRCCAILETKMEQCYTLSQQPTFIYSVAPTVHFHHPTLP